jgi:hypothetical protein
VAVIEYNDSIHNRHVKLSVRPGYLEEVPPDCSREWRGMGRDIKRHAIKDHAWDEPVVFTCVSVVSIEVIICCPLRGHKVLTSTQEEFHKLHGMVPGANYLSKHASGIVLSTLTV